MTSASSWSPRGIHEKFACELGGSSPRSLAPSSTKTRSTIVRSTLSQNVVAVHDRLGRRHLRELVDAERLPDGVDGGPELRRAQRVAAAQAGEAVDLAERPQEDDVGEPLEEVDRVVRVVVGLELDVGLVESDRDVLRDLLQERRDPGRRQVGAGRVVRVVDADELGRRGDLREHRVEVVDIALGQRHADLPGPRQGRQVRVDRERRPREHDLVARLTQRLRRREQELARPVADRDLGRLDLEPLGDRRRRCLEYWSG